MPDADRLLSLIDDAIVAHGGDLGGWTRLSDGQLQLFDGRVSLRAEIRNDEGAQPGTVHAHVIATLHEHDDEALDACLMGAADSDDAALGQAGLIWVTCVAGPIRSFIDGKPVCMTCQPGAIDGDGSQGSVAGDYGLGSLRAFVGPAVGRGFDDDRIGTALDDTKPWFRYAAESAAPRRVHLAKAMILSNGKQGWQRELEVDGHDISHHESDWPAGIAAPEAGYLTRFAVFEFSPESNELARRAELERTVTYFAEQLPKYDSVDGLMEEMVKQGFDADLVHEAETISTIAFGRMFFERFGVKYASTIIRARRDGRVETDVPLMSLPAYNRGRAIAYRLAQTMPQDDFQRLCFYNAESNAIMKALQASGDKFDFSKVTMHPCVVPDRGVSNQTMNAAVAAMHSLIQRKPAVAKKPWWKFW